MPPNFEPKFGFSPNDPSFFEIVFSPNGPAFGNVSLHPFDIGVPPGALSFFLPSSLSSLPFFFFFSSLSLSLSISLFFFFSKFNGGRAPPPPPPVSAPALLFGRKWEPLLIEQHCFVIQPATLHEAKLFIQSNASIFAHELSLAEIIDWWLMRLRRKWKQTLFQSCENVAEETDRLWVKKP